MTDNFAELLEDCRVGQEVREQRERDAQQAREQQTRAERVRAADRLAKAQRDADAAAAAKRQSREIAALLKAAPALAAELDELADAYNPQRQLRARIEIANDAMQKALAAGAYDLAVKWEAWRNRALAMLGSG
jgi:hypothetical protein